MDGSRTQNAHIGKPLACIARSAPVRQARALIGILFASLLLASAPLRAEPGLWLASEYSRSLNEDFSIRGDNQWRSWDLAKSDFNTLLIRNAVYYRQLGFGYAFLNRGDFGESDKVRTEHRSFQDYQIGPHRFRSEQRWVDGEFSTRYRWKYYVSHNKWFAFNELFLTPDGFNQNRTKIGYRATDKISLAGQYINATRDSMQLVLTWHY